MFTTTSRCPRIGLVLALIGTLPLVVCSEDTERIVIDDVPVGGIHVRPDTLTFEIPCDPLDAQLRASKSIYIEQTDHRDPVTWSLSTVADWLSLSGDTSSGRDVDTVGVTVWFGVIPSGESREADVVLSGRESDTVRVRAVNKMGPLPICVDKSNLLVEQVLGSRYELRVSNCGSGSTLNWTATADRPWVILPNPSGSSTGETDTIDISIDWSWFDWSHTDLGAVITIEGPGHTPAAIDVQAAPDCRVRFVEPGTSTQWTAGDVETIRWETVWGAGTRVYLSLYKGSEWIKDLGEPDPTDLPNLPNTGERVWQVTTMGMTPGNDYQLRITAYREIPYMTCGAVGEFFEISVPACHVSVTDPLRIEEWRVGQARTIRWTTHAPADSVSIDLYVDGAFRCNITPATENDGTYDWTVTKCGGNDRRYQIKITDVTDPSCTGLSEWFEL